MTAITSLFNPGGALTLYSILLTAFMLGLLHGATPDEHTWPITFSYSIGSYSSRKGMLSGFFFSAGFTLQRAILTTLGYLGLATFYSRYGLEGPVDAVVGLVMIIAGSYVLHGRYLHLPFDVLLRGREHHTPSAERVQPHEESMHDVSLRMATVHGLIAGFGFGAYATILTFVLAPQVKSVLYAPLPGLFFGLGTMVMQMIFGAVFAGLLAARKLSRDDICYLGRLTAGRTLYYGGMLFFIVGIALSLIPGISDIGISTGLSIPNLDVIDLGSFLVLSTVGVIGLGSLVSGLNAIRKIDSGQYCRPSARHELG
ncbi:MAG: hypothetical protein QXV32_04700 [Conexivisphaerales archaeon]